MSHYQPNGVVSYSFGMAKQVMLCTDHSRSEYGWLLYRHPDGQWVTLRKATEADLQLFLKDVSHIFAMLYGADVQPVDIQAAKELM